MRRFRLRFEAAFTAANGIMRILLLHPEDSPRRGPWSRQRWDLVVDLGKSSRFSEQQWEAQYQCPILRADVFREGIADLRRVRDILAAGQGQLIDEEGIDWWDLNLRFVPEVLVVLTLRRVAAELSSQAELWATRAAWQVGILQVSVQKFYPDIWQQRACTFHGSRWTLFGNLAPLFVRSDQRNPSG